MKPKLCSIAITKIACFMLLFTIATYFLNGFPPSFYLSFHSLSRQNRLKDADDADQGVKVTCASNDVVQLVVVACEGKSGNTLQETLNMIKSSILFAKCPLKIHVFTKNLEEKLIEKISSWPTRARRKFILEIHHLIYPLSPDETDKMMNWWGPCASFRLFLTDVMPETDAILYVDTDVIFLGPIEELWIYFSKFTPSQVGALAQRVGWNFKVSSENPNYIRKPNGQMTQINSGVFLMNLTRMRMPVFKTSTEISNELQPWGKDMLFPLYRTNIKDMFGDQNLINTVFHYNPDLLFFLPCRYNYQHKFCYDNYSERFCDSGEEHGAFVIHGSANTFYNNYAPAFRVVNDVIRTYDFDEDLSKSILAPIVQGLSQLSEEVHCSDKLEVFSQVLRKSISPIENLPE